MVLKINSLEARHWVLARMVRGAELDPPREPLPHDDPQTVLARSYGDDPLERNYLRSCGKDCMLNQNTRCCSSAP